MTKPAWTAAWEAVPLPGHLSGSATPSIALGKIQISSIEGLEAYLIEWRREYFYKNFMKWIEKK